MQFVLIFFDILFRVLFLVVFLHVILSWFLAPYHPFRMTIARLVEPFLAPIRRVLPSTGMVDFAPMILIFILFIVRAVIDGLLRSI